MLIHFKDSKITLRGSHLKKRENTFPYTLYDYYVHKHFVYMHSRPQLLPADLPPAFTAKYNLPERETLVTAVLQELSY